MNSIEVQQVKIQEYSRQNQSHQIKSDVFGTRSATTQVQLKENAFQSQ